MYAAWGFGAAIAIIYLLINVVSSNKSNSPVAHVSHTHSSKPLIAQSAPVPITANSGSPQSGHNGTKNSGKPKAESSSVNWSNIFLVFLFLLGAFFHISNIMSSRNSKSDTKNEISNTGNNSSVGESDSLTILQKYQKYGFVDVNFNEVIPAIYDEVYPFDEGLAPVKLNGKWGYINKKGEIVISLQYDKAYQFSGGVAYIQTDNKLCSINKKGELLNCNHIVK